MKYLALIGMLFAIVACTATEKGAVIGGATGAAVGGAVSGDIEGAAIGGAVGAVAGALIGKASEPGKCYYRDRYGNRYIADC